MRRKKRRGKGKGRRRKRGGRKRTELESLVQEKNHASRSGKPSDIDLRNFGIAIPS